VAATLTSSSQRRHGFLALERLVSVRHGWLRGSPNRGCAEAAAVSRRFRHGGCHRAGRCV